MPLRKLVWADPDFGPGLAGLAHSQQAGPSQGTWARLGWTGPQSAGRAITGDLGQAWLDWPTVSRPGHHRGLECAGHVMPEFFGACCCLF